MIHSMVTIVATLVLVANMGARVPSATAKLVESITLLIQAISQLRRETHQLKSMTRRPEKR